MQTTNTPNLLQFGSAAAAMRRHNVAAPGQAPDTDTLTAATAGGMRYAMQGAAVHPIVVRETVDALAGVSDWNNHPAVLQAIWNYVRERVMFVQDDDVLRTQLGLSDELELLIEPPLLLSMQRPAGDCDDFTMLVGAMALSAGIPAVEVMTIAADSVDSNRWSHVYLVAHTNDGPIVVDASHGSHVGWEAPRWYRRQGWGQFGGDARAAELRMAQGAQMHGLGDGDGFNWNTFIPQLTTGAFNLATTVLQKPGQYIQGPGGTVISSNGPPAQSIFSATPAGVNATVGTGISSGMVMLGVGAIALILLMKK